jgi:hypothetical protein
LKGAPFRKPLLIAATLALAVLDLYLASDLFAERGRIRDAAQQSGVIEARIQQALAKSATDASASAAQSAVPTSELSPAPAAAPPAAEVEGIVYQPAESAARQLRAYTDPVRRARQRVYQREVERAGHPGLARELGLSEDESDELFTILAEQSLKHDERFYRNELARRRELIDHGVLDEATRAELQAFLGAEKFHALLAYREGLPERLRIRELQNRSGPEQALTTAAARELDEAMRLERGAFEPEIRKLGGAVRFRVGYPEDAWLRDAEPREQRLAFAEQQIPRAEAFYARIRARASAFLTPAQLNQLQQMQEERLASRRAQILRATYVGAAENALRKAEAAASAR